jgi:hypothetical protein
MYRVLVAALNSGKTHASISVPYTHNNAGMRSGDASRLR